MEVSLRQATFGVVVGMAVGAFAWAMILLTVAPSDALVWAVDLLLGAFFGAVAAIAVILYLRKASSPAA